MFFIYSLKSIVYVKIMIIIKNEVEMLMTVRKRKSNEREKKSYFNLRK